MSQIAFEIKPKESDLGDNFVVRRSLPRAEKRLVGPFIFWDHMGPVILEGEREMKVRAHPHIGLATITYLFSGEILHRDSLNNEQYIKPGEVNWMTAGRGIVHSERSSSQEPKKLEGIQLWVALPKEHEDTAPRFDHFKEETLPLIDKGACQLRLIAGKGLDYESPVPVFSDLFYFNGKFKKDGLFSYKLQSNQEAGLYVVSGEIEIEGKKFGRYDMVIFKPGSALEIKGREGSEFMFFGGEILPEKRHIYWNFVSSDPLKIEEAKKRWKEGAFDPVINETEFIPLPDK